MYLSKLINISRHMICARDTMVNEGQVKSDNSYIPDARNHFDDNFRSSFFSSTSKPMKIDVKEKIDISNDTIEETKVYSFCTSTPKSEFDRCEECLDKSECVDCIVKHVLSKHESLRKILF